jgi:hypothetical protein
MMALFRLCFIRTIAVTSGNRIPVKPSMQKNNRRREERGQAALAGWMLQLR